jgi:hypothetical protein
MVDPIARLAAANPELECPPPPIDEVWRRIDAEATTSNNASRGGRHAAFRHLPRPSAVMVALSSLVAVGVAAIAITQLSPRRDSSHTASPGASALIAKLAVLRRPQTAADRMPAHVHIVPRSGTIIPRFTRLVFASPRLRMYIVVVTPAVHNQMWASDTGDQVAIVAVLGHKAAESVPIPAVDLSNADEVDYLSPRGYAHGGPIDLYTVSVVPDGVAHVNWYFVSGALKPVRTVDVAARDNAAIFLGKTDLLWRAAWYAASGRVIPTSDAALVKAQEQMQAAMAAPIIRYLQAHPQPTPSITADYAVFSITSPTGVRTAGGNIISAPPIAKLPWAILASARNGRPFLGGQPDYGDVRHVTTPDGGNLYVIPGPSEICVSSVEKSPFPDGFLGGGGGGSCTGSVTRAETQGIAFTTGLLETSRTYWVVPKSVHSITVRAGDGTRRTIRPPYGVYVSPPFMHHR